jgi:hypothetical protein
VADLMGTLRDLTELGVGFVSLTEALDLTTPSGRAMAGMLAIFAEFEHDPDAAQRLERARTTRWGDSVEHVAQKLRDEAAERETCDGTVRGPREALRCHAWVWDGIGLSERRDQVYVQPVIELQKLPNQVFGVATNAAGTTIQVPGIDHHPRGGVVFGA